MTRIAIGSDHAGFELKSHLIDVLTGEGHDVVDLGTDSTASVDYPAFCAAVGRSVRDGETELGIVLGGSGQGEQLAHLGLPHRPLGWRSDVGVGPAHLGQVGATQGGGVVAGAGADRLVKRHPSIVPAGPVATQAPRGSVRAGKAT